MRILLSKPKAGGERRVALIDDRDASIAAMARWWRCNKRGYVIGTTPDGGMVYLHRLVLGLAPGDGLLADHKNGCRLDNRRENLRVLDSAEANNQNVISRRGSTSRFRGVCWDTKSGRWRAQIGVGAKQIYLGLFEDEIVAAVVAEAARREHMPFALPDPELVVLGRA